MSILVCTTNDKYLPITKTFLNSLFQNSDVFDNVIVRCVGFDYDYTHISDKIQTISDMTSLSKVKNMLSSDGEYINDYLSEGFKKSKIGVRGSRWLHSEEIAYCSNCKVLTILYALKKYKTSVVYSDVDTIVRGDLTGLINIVQQHDLSVVIDEPYSDQHVGSKRLSGHDKLYQGGLIGFKYSDKVLKFVADWGDRVMSDYRDWDADEKYFYETLPDYNLDIGEIPLIYKDEELSIDSKLWSGAGTTKYHEDKYVTEYKKYNVE